MFPSGENGMGATTLAEDLPTHPGEGHTADNSTIVYGEEYTSTSAKRLEEGLVPQCRRPRRCIQQSIDRTRECAILLKTRNLAFVRFCPIFHNPPGKIAHLHGGTPPTTAMIPRLAWRNI